MLLDTRRTRGQSLVLFALALPTILAVVSLAADVGDLYLNRYFIQTGADSAVISGAGYLPGDPSKAISTANSYAASNGIKASEIQSTQVSDSNTKLTMTVTRKVPFYFASLAGVSEGTARAKSAALVQNVGANGNGLRPFGLQYDTPYSFGQQVTLKAGQVGPGNWGPLALGGNGANVYRNNIEYGYSGPPISVGDYISTEPGNMVGPTRQGVNFVISQQQTYFPNDSPTSLTQGDPRIMIIPMVDYVGVRAGRWCP